MPINPNSSVIGSSTCFQRYSHCGCSESHCTSWLPNSSRVCLAHLFTCNCRQVLPSAGQCWLQWHECTCGWQFTVYSVPITYATARILVENNFGGFFNKNCQIYNTIKVYCYTIYFTLCCLMYHHADFESCPWLLCSLWGGIPGYEGGSDTVYCWWISRPLQATCGGKCASCEVVCSNSHSAFWPLCI